MPPTVAVISQKVKTFLPTPWVGHFLAAEKFPVKISMLLNL